MSRLDVDPDAGHRTVRAAVLVALLTGTFMAQFDFFVVNVAAPSIRLDLQASEAELELVVGGYAFAYAGALVLGGRLGDLFGYRRLFVSGMIAFAVTSALCGLAVSPGQLISARLGQGLAAALMLPQVLALISSGSSGSSGHGRARAMAWFGVAGGVGSIAGQVLGGLLVTADLAGLGWRLIFLINVPIGVLGALFARRVLPPREPGRGANAKLDPLGALGLAVGLGLLLVPLTVGRAAGWPLWAWISMAASVPALAVTLRWQQTLYRRGGQPLLELSLFRAVSFRSGVLSNLAFMLYFPSYMFTLALLLQGGLGLGAFEAGLVFVPAGLTFSVSALLAPRLAVRYGSSVLIGGCLLAAAGLAALAAVTATGGADTSVAVIVLITAAISFGNGLILPALIGAALRDVPPHHAGAAAGALTTTQQFGSAAGVASVGTIYFAAAEHGAGVGMAWACTVNAVLALSVAAAVGYGVAAHRRAAVHPQR
ncbi:MFS transporter [Kribbella sp. NPDC048928]|uniref:MFS transporter n=1 Tax=Kribbella sp. NPDC048928 TaxID=3364111 RepID=UPI0037171006